MKTKLMKYIAGLTLPLAFAIPANPQNFDRSSLDSLFNSGISKEISKAYGKIIPEEPEMPVESPMKKSENLILKFCPKSRVDHGVFAVGYDYFDSKTHEANFYIYDAKQIDYKYPKLKASIPTRAIFESQYEPLKIIYELSIEKMYKEAGLKDCVDLKVKRTEEIKNFGNYLPGK